MERYGKANYHELTLCRFPANTFRPRPQEYLDEYVCQKVQDPQLTARPALIPLISSVQNLCWLILRGYISYTM